ncbi:hypothetical protein G210_3500 [Candida maltosa Xu316]|uniref:Uncharacterized protein n=1 Tax=Candida maltosa (strain Xu316) TaxID=1245528 RepID=M3IIR2_CANMX|nr:hypothetical protein G210_3500 [Candida maltosa Xu316]
MYLFNQPLEDEEKYVHLAKRSSAGAIGGLFIAVAIGIAVITILSAYRMKARKLQKVQHQQNQQSTTVTITSRGRVIGPLPNTTQTTTSAPAAAGTTNQHEIPDDYVPPYSENVNEIHDMGYYDEMGKFHSVDITNNEVPPPPPEAHVR